MERKFKQAVSMLVHSNKDIDFIVSEIRKMGYKTPETYFNQGYISNKWNSEFRLCLIDLASRYLNGRYYIDHYNPDLFLAISAMSEGEDIFFGEWLFCKSDGNNKRIQKGGLFQAVSCVSGVVKLAEPYDDSMSYSKAFFRKATLEELVAHFTKEKAIEAENESAGRRFMPLDWVVRKSGRLARFKEHRENGECIVTVKEGDVFENTEFLRWATPNEIKAYADKELPTAGSEQPWQPKNGEMIEASGYSGDDWMPVEFIGMHGKHFVCTTNGNDIYTAWPYARPITALEVPLSDLIAAWAERNGKNPELVKVKES